MGHIGVGLIISNIFISELVLHKLVIWSEGVDRSVSFSIDSKGEDHNPRTSIERADRELDR